MGQVRQRFTCARRIVTSGVVIAALSAMPAPAAAKPKPGSCAKTITACGCVIDQPGIYTAANDLSASQTTQSNCIEIAPKGSGAILNLMGVRLLGNDDGTGIGILIRKDAVDVIVEGGLESNNTPPQNPVGSPPESSMFAKVNLWDVGIEDDGDRAVIVLFADIGGSLLGGAGPVTPKGNATAGVFLNGVKGSFVGDFNANFNSKFGVIMKGSSDVTLANFTAASNHDTGVRLESSDQNSIGPGGASSNTNDGMLLLDSSRNTIHDSNGNSFNGNTGIMLACGSGDLCPLADGSSENRIVNAGAPANSVAGIVINLGNLRNTVTLTNNHDNGGPNDMIDLNPDCDHNTWYNNVGTGNQNCVQ